VVRTDEIGPTPVAELGLPLRRADDVREENRREDALELRLLVAQNADELLDLLEVRLTVFGDDVHGRTGQRLVPGAGDQPGEREGLVRLLAAAAQHERRNTDRAEDMADVGFVEHAVCGSGVAGACGNPHVLEVPVHLLVIRHALERAASSARLGHRPHAPLAVDVRHLLLELAFPRPPRVVGCPRDAGSRVAENECGRSFGVSRREHAAERATVRERDEHGSLTPCGVEDDLEVVDALLNRWQAVPAQAVGETGAAVVEADQSSEARKAVGEVDHDRQPPVVFELRDEGPDAQDVDAAAEPSTS
jgi:hypothetical protein